MTPGTTTSPYRDAAWTYVEAGWLGVLPLPAGRKFPPPGDKGHGGPTWTGHGAPYPSGADVQEWCDGPEGRGNIGLRMPGDVLGIDVDAYSGKRGAATLADAELSWGLLPPTWRSSARWAGGDHLSGIRFFRIPAGLRWPGQLGAQGGHVELIQKTHRYAVAWPSVNPDAGGTVYRWISPDGHLADGPPRVEDLPALPERWVEGLTRGQAAEDVHSAELDRAEVIAAIERWDSGPGTGCCPPMATTRDRLLAELMTGSSHDALRRLWGLVRLGEQGHAGLSDAVTAVRDAWTKDVTNPHRKEGRRDLPTARAEWGRSLDGAVRKVAGRPSIDERPAVDPCLAPFSEWLDAPAPHLEHSLDDREVELTPTAPERVEPQPAPQPAPAPEPPDPWDAFEGLHEPAADEEPPTPQEPAQPAPSGPESADGMPEGWTDPERIDRAAQYLLRDELARQKARRLATRQLDEEDAHLLGDVDTESTGGRSSWAPRSVLDVLEGRVTEEPPAVLLREDKRALFYRGKVNGLLGESESGKTWVALHAVAQELKMGNRVMFLDFEDGVEGIVGRLLAQGVPPEVLHPDAGLFVYLAPEEALGPRQADDLRETLESRGWALIVLDGANAAMTLLGHEINSNGDATAFTQQILAPLKRTGAAVVMIDHLPKDSEKRGKGGVGAQAKRAMLDGCQLTVTPTAEFGRGKEGRLQLVVDKDRPGHVRGFAVKGSRAGTAVLMSNAETGAVAITIEPALDFVEQSRRAQEEGRPVWRPTAVMEKVSRFLATTGGRPVSGNAIAEAKLGKAEYVRQALDHLVEGRYVERSAGPRGAILHKHVTLFRESDVEPQEGDV